VGTLDLEAYPYLETGVAVCAMLDVGRGEVATANFNCQGHSVGEETIWTPDALLDSITEPTQFCGEGVVPWVSLIKDRLGPIGIVMASPSPGTRLWSLAAIARDRLVAGITDDPIILEPNYIRMPSIGTPKQRDRRRQRA
jgi:tRNA A37 threonylcarbamoyladenosine modification protein TsaB